MSMCPLVSRNGSPPCFLTAGLLSSRLQLNCWSGLRFRWLHLRQHLQSPWISAGHSSWQGHALAAACLRLLSNLELKVACCNPVHHRGPAQRSKAAG